MTKSERLLKAYLKTIYLRIVEDCVGTVAVSGQLVLLLTFIFCLSAPAQSNQGADYTRNSQPPLFTYQELVTLGAKDPVDPALAGKLQTLLTTPFVNNEAYFAGTRPHQIGRAHV